MKKNIFINKKNWHLTKKVNTEIFFKGFGNKKKISFILNNLSSKNSLKEILNYIKNLEENFAIIIKKNNNIYAATDKIRSFPLLYFYNGKEFFIFENYNHIKNLKIRMEINEKQVLFFSLSGYTLNEETLYKNVKQIKQGTILSFLSNKITHTSYYHFNKKSIDIKSNLESKLKKINEKIILKLIESCEKKFIVVPLSAGYDSRFILSGLKNYGFKNVIAFSYGRIKNREVKIAKLLTKRMDVPWHYIPYTNSTLKRIMLSQEHQEYEKYSDCLTSIHFPQDFWAIKYLKQNHLIPKNSVIVNGQTGDFITGNHLPSMNYQNKNIIERIIKYYIFKHYNLWNKYFNEKKDIMFKFIYSSIKKDKYNFEKTNIYKLYETLEFENRQCKYVVNGQRLYEYFDYEWRLPLWDNLYLNFWASVPLQEKMNQSLYKRTLHRTDWCGVWNSIPLNPDNSFANHIELLRFFLKGFFVLKGKQNWHAFEKKYLNYFIDPLCGYAQWKYSEIIKDRRGFRNSISWQTAKYLQKKNIDWEKII